MRVLPETLSNALSRVYEKYLKQSKLKALAGEKDLKEMLADIINGTFQTKISDISTSIKNIAEKLDEQIARRSRDASMRQSFNNVVIDDGPEILNGSYESSKKQTPPRLMPSAVRSPQKLSASIGVQVSLDRENDHDILELGQQVSTNVKIESNASDKLLESKGVDVGVDPKPFQEESPQKACSNLIEQDQVQAISEMSAAEKIENSENNSVKFKRGDQDQVDTQPRYQMEYGEILALHEIRQKLDLIYERLPTSQALDPLTDPIRPIKKVKTPEKLSDSMSNFSEQMAEVENRGILATNQPKLGSFDSNQKVPRFFQEFIPLVNSYQHWLNNPDKRGQPEDVTDSLKLNLSNRIIDLLATFIDPKNVG